LPVQNPMRRRLQLGESKVFCAGLAMLSTQR
jgi:hypothetical protein